LPEADYTSFLAKYESMRSVVPSKASHLIVIGMKRQALPDKRLPEWEEICATAASVQANRTLKPPVRKEVFLRLFSSGNHSFTRPPVLVFALIQDTALTTDSVPY
jgi:hypothetical protein